MISELTYIRIKNRESVSLSDIPLLSYNDFFEIAVALLNNEDKHCVSYFAFDRPNDLMLIMAVADDKANDIILLAHKLNNDQPKEFESLSSKVFALHIFEREMHENFGIEFINHPWLKPVRYAADRFNKQHTVNQYPFYKIQSDQLHEVSVGPVHAGIIEPGLFRFICHGEKVLHLEIQLGWQHRGIESLMLQKKNVLQRSLLAENIAGDTVIGHTCAFAQTIESLADIEITNQVCVERSLASELERIAIHTADIGALCLDAAYYLGANVFGILRTGIINFTQRWCGNRLGKSLIRPGGANFPFTEELKSELIKVLDAYERKFLPMIHLAYHKPGIQNRFDRVGEISKQQAFMLGNVGLSAKMSNLNRDIRASHPYAAYEEYPLQPVLLESGDVFARFLLKRKEIKQSLAWIRNLLENYTFNALEYPKPVYNALLKPDTLTVSLTEGWRGEICHCAITGPDGNIIKYKIKDPSMHNWKSLELSLRDVEISDFPINNKSYNLSYCGHDL
jgi:Ni,Fe-hydrogenase III large subunit/NADH:ubiquinone oxidoreductase subunit C